MKLPVFRMLSFKLRTKVNYLFESEQSRKLLKSDWTAESDLKSVLVFPGFFEISDKVLSLSNVGFLFDIFRLLFWLGFNFIEFD